MKIHKKLDLHGQRYKEASENLDKFLNDSAVSAVTNPGISVLVIHGNGGGVLQQMTTEYLKECTFISRFYEAPSDLGGCGATIVEF